jgi:hypothetical protein
MVNFSIPGKVGFCHAKVKQIDDGSLVHHEHKHFFKGLYTIQNWKIFMQRVSLR